MGTNGPRRAGRMLHLNAFLHADGHHEAAWRHGASSGTDVLDPAHYVHLARTAERGCFDSVFLADNLALSDNARWRAPVAFEPLTLLAALADATTSIGLIGTASTTYQHPFHLARQLS